MKIKIEYHADSEIIKAIYTIDKNGVKQGDYEDYYKSGKLRKKGAYAGGKEDGLWEYYYENGRLWKKCTYKNGEKDGLYEAYYENSQLGEKCFYKNGKKDGPYLSYREDGRADTQYVYRNGERLTGAKPKKYLKEWNKIQQSPQSAREILNARLNQFDKQMRPTKLRQWAKRAEVAKFRALYREKSAGR